MFRPRVIPCLLLKGTGLVKTIQFRDPRYVGDPINAVRIFNEKEVDELIFLDIMQSRGGVTSPQTGIPFDHLAKISRECFMPLSYGGGISTLEQIGLLLKSGVEKVVLNTSAIDHPELISLGAASFGSQSIIASIDTKKEKNGKYQAYTEGGTRPVRVDPVTLAQQAESAGAGEIMITSIDYDGMMKGYDIDLIRMVSDAVHIPVIACGGAGSLDDLKRAHYEGHASAVAAGSMFVFFGKNRAVLINYPEQDALNSLFSGI